LEKVEGGLWKRSIPLYALCVRGTWWGDFITGNHGRYVEKALETGILIGVLLGNLEGGSYTGDVERRK